jgi:hypothetical protein
MGVRQWMQRQKFNDPVPGTFEVQNCDWGKSSDLAISGVLSVPGLNPLPADYHGKTPHDKHPIIGQVLPVIVDRSDPTQFRIEWDQVPTQAQRIDNEFEIAQERASTVQTGFGSNFRSTNITVTDGDLSSLPPEAQQQIQSLLGNLGQALQQGLAGNNANVVIDQPQVTVSGPHAHQPAPPNWDQATATVLACHNAKVPTFASNQAPGGIVDLTVDVRLADGYEYSTKTRVAFSTPERRAKVVEKGTELPVRVDPADPNRVVIDIERIPHW